MTRLKDFTVIDFETTGLNTVVDQVIQIALIRVRNGKPAMTFNSYVQLDAQLKYGRGFNPDITKWTGITEDQLEGGLSPHHAFQLVYEMLYNDKVEPEPELIVGHNVLFDMSFLESNLKRYSPSVIDIDAYADFQVNDPFIDTLTISRDRQPYPHKLEAVAGRLGVELSNAHDALHDAMATMQILLAFDAEKPVYDEYLSVAGYRPKYGEPEWYPVGTTLKKQGAAIYDVTPSEAKKPKALPKRPTVMSNRNKRTPKG